MRQERKLILFLQITGMVCLLFLLNSCRTSSKEAKGKMLSYTSGGEGARVELRLSSLEISTADLLKVELFIRAHESSHVTLPVVADTWGDFLVFVKENAKPALLPGGVIESQSVILLDPEIPGEAELPALAVIIKDENNNTQELKTKPIKINVHSSLIAEKKDAFDIIDNTPPKSVSIPPWVMVLAFCNLAAGLLVTLLWCPGKERKK